MELLALNRHGSTFHANINYLVTKFGWSIELTKARRLKRCGIPLQRTKPTAEVIRLFEPRPTVRLCKRKM